MSALVKRVCESVDVMPTRIKAGKKVLLILSLRAIAKQPISITLLEFNSKGSLSLVKS